MVGAGDSRATGDRDVLTLPSLSVVSPGPHTWILKYISGFDRLGLVALRAGAPAAWKQLCVASNA